MTESCCDDVYTHRRTRPCNGDTMLRRVRNCRFIIIIIIRPIDALDVLCAQLTRDLFAIAKFLLNPEKGPKSHENDPQPLQAAITVINDF